MNANLVRRLLLFIAALIGWVVYARLLHIGAAGWWAYPGWWPGFFPSYFQLGTIGFTTVFFVALRRFIPAPVVALAVVAGAMVVFPQSPATDVAFVTGSLPWRIAFFILGAVFTAFVAGKALPLAPFLYVASVSLVLAVFTLTSDQEGLSGTVGFLLLHLALPAQFSAFVLAKWAPAASRPSAA